MLCQCPQADLVNKTAEIKQGDFQVVWQGVFLFAETYLKNRPKALVMPHLVGIEVIICARLLGLM